jgi:hypothetical protein
VRPIRHWYASGVVVRPELTGSLALKVLLWRGLAAWLKQAQVTFPCEWLALAYSAQGQALLERFGFARLQAAEAMPDRVPLFGLPFRDRQRFVSLFKGRGLDVG